MPALSPHEHREKYRPRLYARPCILLRALRPALRDELALPDRCGRGGLPSLRGSACRLPRPGENRMNAKPLPPYACHNRPRPTAGGSIYLAQDGWHVEPDATRHEPYVT